MKSRLYLLILCLVLPLASCTPNASDENSNPILNSTDEAVKQTTPSADNASKEQTAGSTDSVSETDAIPEVPENGTLEDYEAYVNNLKKAFDKKAQIMNIQAQKDGMDPKEFFKSLKEMGKEYFIHMEKATDKAMRLNDVQDYVFENLLDDKIEFMLAFEEDIEVVNAKMQAFADQLREMNKSKYAEEIEFELFANKVKDYAVKGNVEGFAKIAAEIDEKVEKAGKDITPKLAQQAMLIALLSNELKNYEAPEDRLANYKKALGEASDPEVNKLVSILERTIIHIEGVKRFNELLGKEFLFSGTFLDGSEYKTEDYAGKVVLIDFWATWCGPCCAELPNVKKAYAAYHDKGFEVIGVSCDDPAKEDEFKGFLKENAIPWKQMLNDKAVVPGEKSKDGKPVTVSQYYSINGIPCPVLIGKNGKVLSLDARGEELEKQLAKIFDGVEETPVEETPAEETPAEETPAEETPAEPAAPAEEAAPETAEETPAEPAAPAEEAAPEATEEAPAEPAAPAEEAAPEATEETPAEPAAPAEEAAAEEAASETTSDVIVSEGVNDEGESDDEAVKSDDEKADSAEDAIPEVPENGTLKDYQEYIVKVNEAFRNKARVMLLTAQANRISPQSEEFSKPFNSMAKGYIDRIFEATDKAMLLKDVSDDDLKELVNGKIQLIQAMAQINSEGEDAFIAKVEAIAAQLRQMGKNNLADGIEARIYQTKILGYARSGNVEEFAKAAAAVDEKVEKAGKDISPALAHQAILIVLLANELPEYKAPEGRIDKYTKALKEASDPDVNKLADDLQALLFRAQAQKRFKETLGNEFKFGGTFTDGSEYKAEDYAGKVVLIDFWATWCGPCRAELPNVKKMYAAYHDKGFEVIGVTCDDPDEEENLNKFLKDNDIPWKQMFDSKAVIPGEKFKDGKPILVSNYYGINAIPCPILIGKDGKVISLNARGEELKEQLVKIYGKVEVEESADDEPEELDDDDDDIVDFDEEEVADEDDDDIVDLDEEEVADEDDDDIVDLDEEDFADEDDDDIVDLDEEEVADEDDDDIVDLDEEDVDETLDELDEKSDEKLDTNDQKDNDQKAADDSLPEVPQNATYVELKEYVNNLDNKAQKEGLNLHSDEFKDSQKERAKDYFNHIIQAMDKALQLKVPENEYEYLINDKIEILGILAKLNGENEETVNAKLNEFIKQLRQENKVNLADLVEFNIVKGKLEKLVSEMREKAKPIIEKAKEDGIEDDSPEYFNLLKGVVEDYFDPAEQLMDKALLLKYKPDYDFKNMAMEKLSMLRTRAIFRNEDLNTALSRVKPIVDQLRSLGRTECAVYIELEVLESKIVLTDNNDEFAKVADELDQMIDKAGKDISYDHSRVLQNLIMFSGIRNYEVPKDRLLKYANTFSESSDKRVQEYGPSLQIRAYSATVDSCIKNGNVEEFAKLAAEMDEKVEKAGKDIDYVLAAQAKIILLSGYKFPGYKAPKEREDKYVKIITETSDRYVKNYVADDLEQDIIKAKAEKRFLNLLGKEFKFGGTFIDGSKYKAKDYAGKVVLIDFWATWCGPCCAELPNVKKMYAAYHDKGFEVIGVTLDKQDNEAEFKEFLDKNQILWKQMFDGKAFVPGLETKDGKPVLVSDYYGINAIPCPILIGQDGKVLSLDARGEELKEQLVRIYGEVEQPADEDTVPALEDNK